MKYRSLVSAIALLLLLILPAAVNAQDDTMDMDTCFGLEQADCDVINAAHDNLDSLTSFTVDYDLAFSMSGLSPALPLPLPESLMALLADRTSLTFNSTGTIDMIAGEEGERGTIGAVAEVSYDETDGGDLVTMPVEMRLVDNSLYILKDGAWQGASLDIDETDAELMAQLDAMPINPVTGEINLGSMGDMGNTEGMGDINIAGLATLPGLVSYVRDGDTFTLTIDLNALSALLEPENTELYEGITLALSQVDQQLGFMAAMLPSIPFDEGTISVVQHVDTDLNIVDSIDVSVALNINIAQFMGQPDGAPIVMHLDFSADLSNVNSAPVASAPTDFEEVDLPTLMGMNDDGM